MLILLAMACGSGKATIDDSSTAGGDDSGDTETTPGGDDTGNVVEGESPSVLGVHYADCSKNTDDEDIWIIQLDVTDPQGVGDVDGGTVTYMPGGEPDAVADLACAGGTCSGSYESTATGVTCDLGADDFFRAVIVDEDGYRSAPYDFTP